MHRSDLRGRRDGRDRRGAFGCWSLRCRCGAWPYLALLSFGLAAVLLLAGCRAGATTSGAGAGGQESQVAPAATASATPKPRATTATKGATPKPRPTASNSGQAARPKKAGAPVRIVFVDVGQGDAILLKSGSTEVLVDGGPSAAAGAVMAAMRSTGMDDLDYVVATHMHADHVGATPELVRRYRPAKALIAGPCETRLRSALQAAGTRTVQVRRGATLRFGSVKAKVLSPGDISGDKNADSVVLLLEANGRRILLTGDCTGPNEAAVGSITARGPPLYALKVSHHGSAYSTSADFLAQARPQFAVIQVGHNSYGHPTAATVTRLRHAGARIYTTQRNGTITLTIAASGSAAWRFVKSSKPLLKVAGKASASSVAAGKSTRTSGGGTTVYITRTGECYHRGGCRSLSRSRIAISLAQAKARGYRPCKICRPPR